MCDHNENDNSEIIEINEQDNFKFSLDSLPNKPPSPLPLNSSLSMTTSNLRFGLQEDLGKIFALQGNNNNVTFDNHVEHQIEQHYHNYYRKIARPTPPSLNTNLLLMSHNNNNHNNNHNNNNNSNNNNNNNNNNYLLNSCNTFWRCQILVFNNFGWWYIWNM
ncbi:hypothetical protein Glove_402g63 [Diversispora epigaea]|uniref:Uncharacterized protein n=1 Tax=Diversispora epigaea TaxID=1348612 RepID=A0A397H3Z7_9GLOM|nr:hypothetical protein Glove_402g63 [Diversispora epigaea]